MTLEKPPTTLGENQFESSSLFLENAFYREKIFSAKNQQNRNFSSKQNLSVFSPNDNLKNAVRAVRTVQMYGCTDRTDCTDGRTDLYGQPSEKVQKIASSIFVLKINFSTVLLTKTAFFCLFFMLFRFAEVLPVCVPNCCLFLLLVQKSPLLSCSPSPNLLMKE